MGRSAGKPRMRCRAARRAHRHRSACPGRRGGASPRVQLPIRVFILTPKYTNSRNRLLAPRHNTSAGNKKYSERTKEYLNSAANAAGISGSERTNIFVKIFAARCARAGGRTAKPETHLFFRLACLSGRSTHRARTYVCRHRRRAVRLALTRTLPLILF